MVMRFDELQPAAAVRAAQVVECRWTHGS
jgi:hypothetical protein